MITGPDFKKVITVLNKKTLAEYWNNYFAYQNKGAKLYLLTEKELKEEIEKYTIKQDYFIDSQVVISNILGRLSSKHNFHRQFSELFSEMHREQVLGMQLYSIMVCDNRIWVYSETQNSGHKFPHATYFIPSNGNKNYKNLCEKYENESKYEVIN